MENTEKKYKIKIGATAQYMQIENNWETAKIISELEGKKIFIHDLDDNENYIWISQYEKTGKIKIPVELLEEYIEENIESDIEKTKFDYKEYLKENKTIIIACFIVFLLIMLFSINGKSLKTNILEQKQEKTLFQTLSDRNIILDKKEDLELQIQKEFREKISESKKRVEEIRKEKIEISKQKLELAQ